MSKEYTSRAVQIEPQTDSYAKVADIAKRLGVEPCEKADFAVHLIDGRMYDIYELVNAFLDKIDGALKDA